MKTQLIKDVLETQFETSQWVVLSNKIQVDVKKEFNTLHLQIEFNEGGYDILIFKNKIYDIPIIQARELDLSSLMFLFIFLKEI